MRWTIGAIASLGLLTPSVSAQAAALPPLVSAYVDQVVRQCGGQGASASLVDRLDLNGDRIDDYVVDGARQPCPGRPAPYAEMGSLVTVFLGRSDGLAYPGLQRNAQGAYLERKPQGGYALWLNLAGEDCGTGEQRCARQVVWRGEESRLDLAPFTPKPK